MDLLKNPFHILAASPRDNRRRIMELADERSLLLDSNDCIQARSDLTNPRRRLSAEVAWLPGVGPRRVGEVVSLLESSPTDLLSVDKMTPIARANLLAAALAILPCHTPENAAEWILEIAWAFERVDSTELKMVINEERIVSGFPEVTDLSALESEIQERRQHYRHVIKSALNNLYAKDLVGAVTIAVESATDGGEEQGPILIADLVDSYEVEAQGFLEKEEGNIRTLVEKLREAVDAKCPDNALAPVVNRLVQVVKNWDTVAQPIQVSAKSRGIDHAASRRVAELVQSLTNYMFNEHGKIKYAQKLTIMMREVFAEVGEVAERLTEDADVFEKEGARIKLGNLLDPIFDLCKAARENTEKDPSSGDKEARKIMNAAPRLIVDLAASEPGPEILYQWKDELALTIMHCAVVYGNKTEEWKSCISFLEEALKFAASTEAKSRIEKNLETVRENERLYRGWGAMPSPPKLYTFKGIGTTLYGSTDHDPASGSYISTYYFIFLFIPVFPICRYRVIPTPGGYRFLGKASLREFDKWHFAISLGLIAWMFFGM